MSDPTFIRDNLDESLVKSFFEENYFYLIYQKKVTLGDSEHISGVEAYLRMKKRGMEPYSPAVFMPIVERMGLMPDLFLLIVRQATDDWAVMQLMGLDCPVFVNVDVETLKNKSVLEDAVNQVERSAMPNHLLGIDVKLDDVSQLTDSLFSALDYLKNKGIKSCLELEETVVINETQLIQLGVSEIKLPRSLIEKAPKDEKAKLLLEGYVEMALNHRLKITAVGIETQEEVGWLQSLRVDYGQGYFYGKPVELSYLEHQSEIPTEASEKNNILVMEQGRYFSHLLEDALADESHINTVQDIETFCDVLDSENLSLLVVQVDFDEQSGFALMDRIQEQISGGKYPCIFVAEEDDLDLQLKAYEYFGFAFLTCATPLIEFISTVNRAMFLHKKNQAINEELNRSTQVAMQSMREAANYGDIVQLMKNISLVESETEMTRYLFQFMTQRQLQTAVVFRNGNNVLNFDSSHKVCSATELNVFEILHTRGRLYEFGSRLMVNGESVSFLVKNMPEDAVDCGQIRDYVAAIIECMEARYQSILQNRSVQSVIDNLISVSQDAMQSVENAGQKKKALVDYINAEISLSFHVLDLTGEQEDYLKSLVEKLVQDNDWEEGSSEAMVTRLDLAVSSLRAVFKPLEEKVESLNVDEFEDEDVELF